MNGGTFPGKDRSLPGRAPAIVTGNTRCMNHAVTGDEEADRIFSGRISDSSRALWRSNRIGDLRIASKVAGRDFNQGAPDFVLEPGSFYEQVDWLVSRFFLWGGEDRFDDGPG